MAPRLSVIIPCHNAEAYIQATLQSVFDQTWPNIEVIVVDDGSTDGSVRLVSACGGQRVRLVEQSNKGAAAARNHGFSVSTGEFIQFLDADDIIDPDKLHIQMARLLDRPDCVASAEWGRFYDRPENTVFEPEANWADLDPIEWLVRSRAEGGGMLFPALWLAPRSIVSSAGPWDETLSLGDDGEYFTRIVLASRQVLFCSGARCRYRSGLSGSLSSSKDWASGSRVIELCEAHVRAREDSLRVRRGFSLSWQHFAHASFPFDREIAEHAMARARALHPAVVWPDGGPAFKILSRVVGWRAARRLQVASGRR